MGTHSATERLRDIDLKRRGLAASAFLFIYLLILGLLKGKARRVIAEILCYIMLTTLCPPGLQLQSAAVPVSTWEGLSDALINGGDYVLNEDIIAPEGAEGFLVVNDASLNLNGHTIDAAGNITDSAVINVYDTLTITNESGLSAPMGGYIKGGCNMDGNGGGIYIAKSGTLNMDGGAIVDCTVKNGGGIFSEGNLYFGGGKVGEQGHGNHAIENGGGIFLSRTYGFDVENAVLIGNEAGDYGGGIFINGEDGFNSDDIGSDQENASTVSEDSVYTVSEDNAFASDYDTASSAGEKSVSPDSVERINLRSASLGPTYVVHSGTRFLWPQPSNSHSANVTFNIKNISSCSADYGEAIAFGNTDGSQGSQFITTSCIFNISNICSNTANKAGGGMYMGCF
ncbi:MAG: hypothetical protein K5668_06630 [Lachnospiraceae bacterium]|nr:hypothetical protein [Lachnospiraceae bacterium]